MINKTKGFINVVVIVVIALIALILVGAAWWYESQDEDTESNANINTSIETNVNTQINANLNTNTNLNTTIIENTNTVAEEDSGCPVWPTYINTEYEWTMQYPCDWTYEEFGEETGDDLFIEYPYRYTVFTSPTEEHRLLIGIMKAGDSGSTITRTGIGAGDFIDVDPITVAGLLVPVRHLIFEGNLYEVFFYSAGAIDLGGYLMTATFDENGDYDLDLTDTIELDNAITMMESIQLP